MARRMCRLDSPPTRRIARRGTRHVAAISLMSASFAAPSTGGAATRTRRALSRMPEISVLRDRGIRRTFSSTPVGVGRTTALTILRRHRTQPGQKNIATGCSHTTINAELAEPAEKTVLFCEFCGFCVECRAVWRVTDVSRGAVMSTQIPSVAPIALQPGEGEARWFLGFLVTIKSSGATTNGRVTVIEHLGTRGLGSPLHVHHNEDEWFYVTEGELTFWVGGQLINAPEGSFVYGPRGIPHTLTVTPPEARILLVTERAGFERLLRALSVPALGLTIPPAAT